MTGHGRATEQLALAGAAGAVLGFACARVVFVGSGWSIVAWAVVGLILGASATEPCRALLHGAVYGFVLSFVFMVAGYQGDADTVTRIPFFTALGIVGALSGLALAAIGHAARSAASGKP
jgi:hypothetical protein